MNKLKYQPTKEEKPIKYKTTHKSQPETSQVDIPNPKLKMKWWSICAQEKYADIWMRDWEIPRKLTVTVASLEWEVWSRYVTNTGQSVGRQLLCRVVWGETSVWQQQAYPVAVIIACEGCSTVRVTFLFTYLLTYLLTAWSTVLQKLTGFQLVKFPAFYGTRSFMTAFTNARHLPLSWASSIQSVPSLPTSWKSILILSSHILMCLPSGLFSSGFPTKILYTTLLSPIRATCPANLILLDLITQTILVEQYISLSSSLCIYRLCNTY